MSKFKEFLQKAGKVVPGIVEVGGNIIGGNYLGAIKNVGELLKGESEKNEEAKELLQEFELKKLEFEQELKNYI